MNRQRTRLTVITSLAVALTGCDLSAEPVGLDEDTAEVAADDVTLVVEVHDDDFVPEDGEIAVGETVVWDFAPAGRPHNVVFTDVASDVTDDGTWALTFAEPGTYHYECTLHTGMTGQVTVTG